MSAEDNRALAYRWFEELWNQGNVTAIDELATTDFVLHHPARPEQPVDLATYKQLYPVYRGALPDLHIVVEDTVAEEAKVAVRLTQSGTHLGEYRGRAPSGKRITWTGLVLFHIRDGKIAEAWADEDWQGFQHQLGATPLSAPPAG